MAELHYILDLKGKNKLHIIAVPEAFRELTERLSELGHPFDFRTIQYSDEHTLVEEQAGAGSHYEVFPPYNERGLMDKVTQLGKDGIKCRIYRVIELEQLELVPARLRPIALDNPFIEE